MSVEWNLREGLRYPVELSGAKVDLRPGTASLNYFLMPDGVEVIAEAIRRSEDKREPALHERLPLLLVTVSAKRLLEEDVSVYRSDSTSLAERQHRSGGEQFERVTAKCVRVEHDADGVALLEVAQVDDHRGRNATPWRNSTLFAWLTPTGGPLGKGAFLAILWCFFWGPGPGWG
jgi:hypothetical protein